MQGQFDDKFVARILLEKIDIGLKFETGNTASLDAGFFQTATQNLNFLEIDDEDVGRGSLSVVCNGIRPETRLTSLTIPFAVDGYVKAFHTVFPMYQSDLLEGLNRAGANKERDRKIALIERLGAAGQDARSISDIKECITSFPDLRRAVMVVTVAGERQSVATQVRDAILKIRNS